METNMYRICPAAEIFQTQGKAEEFSVVAVLPSHVEAEETVKRLKSSGIDLKNCSIVGKENPSGEHVIGYYTIGSRIAFWGKMGAFWGGLWGLLSASAFFLIPGIGPVVVGGTFVSAIVGALEGAVVVGGLSALGSAFYYIGVPTKTILDYETAVKEDCFIVIVHGNSDDVAKAKLVLESSIQSEKSEVA